MPIQHVTGDDKPGRLPLALQAPLARSLRRCHNATRIPYLHPSHPSIVGDPPLAKAWHMRLDGFKFDPAKAYPSDAGPLKSQEEPRLANLLAGSTDTGDDWC